MNEHGWIPVDNQMRTNVAHIFAIGDIVGEPMLAHKATHEGNLAAEVIAGMSHHAKKILGAHIVGVNAGELIAETVLALEMGADAEDIGLTIHPHPTLSETVFFSAEMAEGTITDMMPPKKSG